MNKVYFAGKVARGNWRERLLGDGCMSRRDFPFTSGCVYGGPFALSCDHGCSHEPGTHACAAPQVGEGYCTFTDEHGKITDYVPRQTAVNRCLQQIKMCDRVVAYLEADAHGTLAEIGYASALRKPIFLWLHHSLAKDEETGVDEFWFVKRLTGVTFMGYGEPEREFLNKLLK